VEIIEAGSKTRPDLNRAIADFVSERLWGEPGRFARTSTLGVFDRGALIAGAVYHNWEPASGVIEMSAASLTPRWLTKPVLDRLFEIPFQRWSCQLVVMRVSERNRRLTRLLHRYGFASVYVPRLRGRDEAELIFTLADDVWRAHRLTRKDYGQIVAA
jgi:hypothetical protein